MLTIAITVTVFIFVGIWILCSLKKVPENQPYIGLISFLGKRTNTWVGSGYTFLPWPFFDIIPIYIGIRNQTVIAEAYSQEEDRMNFQFKVNIHWLPDTENPGELENYIQAGGVTGILDFQSEAELEKFDWAIRQKIADLVKEVIKNFASTHKANECINVTDQIYEKIIERLTGIHDKAELEKLIERFKGKERFRIAERWGLIIDSVFVEPVHPTPDMEEVIKQTAKEKRQQEAELIEISTENEQAKQILITAKALGIDFGEFMTVLQFVKDYKTVREGHGFVIPGRVKSGGPTDDFLHLLGAFLQNKSKKPDAENIKTDSKKSSRNKKSSHDEQEQDEQIVRVRRNKK